MKILIILMMLVTPVPPLVQEADAWHKYLEETKSHFKATKKRKQKLVEYIPRFKNISERKIVKIKFATRFFNDWGRAVYSMGGKIEQDLKPGRRSSKKEYYSFPDDPGMFDDAYDKLEPRTREKGSKQVVTVTSITFENGEVITFQ